MAIRLAGAKTRRIWQEPPPSRQQIWLQQTFCTPVVWISFFRRWMKRKLEANPIGWLEQRTWSGRLLTWGWFAVIVSIYSAVLTDPGFFQRTTVPQNLMAWLLVLSMAISTAGSFRRERESGVLELLLVSPVGERTIISGRLRGLWSQFLPAFGLLLAVWYYLAKISLTRGDAGGALLFYAGNIPLPAGHRSVLFPPLPRVYDRSTGCAGGRIRFLRPSLAQSLRFGGPSFWRRG